MGLGERSLEHLGNGWNEFHQSWDPPGGNVPLAVVDKPEFKDLNGRPLGPSRSPFYKFPWYMRFMKIWYGLRCLWQTKSWPVSVLYFPDELQRDKEIFLEVIKNPGQYFSY